jgi:hypothetical protein
MSEPDNDRDLRQILEKINQPIPLSYTSAQSRRSKKVVLAAVNECGMALRYADPELQSDNEVVGVAIKDCGLALEFASKELRKNRKMVLVAVSNRGAALKYVFGQLRRVKEVVRAAVLNDGLALEYCNARWRNDRDLVLAAVSNNGLALRYASETLQCDEEIVCIAVGDFYKALEYAHSTLLEDESFIVRVSKINAGAIFFANEAIKNSDEMKARIGRNLGWINHGDRNSETTLQELDKKFIEARVANIKFLSNYLEAYGWTVPSNKVVTFADKECYPIDFQVYTEVFGFGSFENWASDHHVIEVNEPASYENLDRLDYVNYYPVYPAMDDNFNEAVSYNDVVVVGGDVDARHYGFCTLSTPYSFISSWDDVHGSFLDELEEYLFNLAPNFYYTPHFRFSSSKRR